MKLPACRHEGVLISDRSVPHMYIAEFPQIPCFVDFHPTIAGWLGDMRRAAPAIYLGPDAIAKRGRVS
jgi:hypothetical protein